MTTCSQFGTSSRGSMQRTNPRSRPVLQLQPTALTRVLRHHACLHTFRSRQCRCSGTKNSDFTIPLRTSAIVLPVLAPLLTAQPSLAASLVPTTMDPQLTEGLVQGFLLIFFSELGDKTFFIALLLALQREKAGVFVGTFGALAIMTVISVFLGRALHEIDELLPPSLQAIPLDDILAVLLLIYFGVATIKDAKDAQEKAAEEKSEAQEAVTELNASSAGLILSTFFLVFAAEWGDKSFLATIALAAASSPVGVTVGAVTGHGVATALAVLGGGVLSKNVDETLVQYAGGALFLLFAAVSTAEIFQKISVAA